MKKNDGDNFYWIVLGGCILIGCYFLFYLIVEAAECHKQGKLYARSFFSIDGYGCFAIEQPKKEDENGHREKTRYTEV